MIPHPHYNLISFGDLDVAVLFLSTAAPEEIEPIAINSDQSIPEYVGAPLDVAGWGLIDG